MDEDDTDRHAFHTTHWSVVLAAVKDDSAAAQEALAELCQVYWYPLYAFVRRRSHTQHDAKDLTQGFFEHLLAKGTLSRAAREKGRFRSFLLGALKHYISGVHRKANAAKRGGGQSAISIDEEFGESRYQIELEETETPETHFNRSWARALLDVVHARLRQNYEKAGQGGLCRALEPYLTDTKKQVTYAEKAAELGTTVSAVTSAVHRLRKNYGKVLRETIGETVSDPGEIAEELMFLKKSVQR